MMVIGLAAAASTAHAQTAANVAIVINDASPESIEVGEYYAQQRRVPSDNVIRLKTSTDETIPRAVYLASIEAPIARALADRNLQDRILYIVLTKGVPLRIQGTVGRAGTAASVDSELTLLYRRMLGRDVAVSGTVENPYFLGAAAARDAKGFSHRDRDIYLVTRLDGFTAADARALVDRAVSPTREGRILLDRRSEPAAVIGDLWLAETSDKIKALGETERADLVETVPETAGALLGYYSWGSNDPANRKRRLGLRFAPGSLAATLAGADARTMKAPPQGWEPGVNTADRGRLFAGSHHALIGDLVVDGATGVAGYVSEPLLASAVRPQILFPAYLSGLNLAEAFYASLPHLSWQSVILGDPLCRPFERQPLATEDTDPGIDERTGLPRFLSNRRIEVARLANPTVPAEAIALMVKAAAQLTGDRDRKAEARITLEEVVRLSPNWVDPQLQLAGLYDLSNEHARAAEIYRRVLTLQPRNAIAMNNLAYRLAVDQKALDEALPLARRAFSLAPRSPEVLDTLGWILHLTGDDREGGKYLAEAARLNPGSPEIRIHLATVSAAVGAYAAAEAHLKEAVRLDPALVDRPDVLQLQERLKNRR